jgi:hypothetical protein
MSVTEISALLVCVLMLIIFRVVLRTPKKSAAKVRPTTLARVQNASFVFSICLWLSLFLGAYWILSFLFGWPFFSEGHIRMVISHNHIYSSPTEMPPTIFWLMIVKQGLAFFAEAVLLRLFWLYRKGILFTAKNVNCIRLLGYFLIIDWFINYQMQSLLRDMDLSTTPVFVGFFIIFFAWIMDEGRQIREEQELTV